MLLFTAITFGGQDLDKVFAHLPEEEAQLLKHQAEEILKIPRDKRIPFLVKEMKRLVSSTRGRLGVADPQQLSLILIGESAPMVEVVLRALPVTTADSVRRYLKSRREVRLHREVKPEILNIIRWKLEELIASQIRKGPQFQFADLINLTTPSLILVCERLGALEIAKSLRLISPGKRPAWAEKMPAHVRGTLEKMAQSTGPLMLPEGRLQAVEATLSIKEWNEGVLTLGIHCIARSALAHSPEYSARLIERHRGTFGQQLAQAVREERKKTSSTAEDERLEVVSQIQSMEREELLNLPQIKGPDAPAKSGKTSVERPPKRGNGPQSG